MKKVLVINQGHTTNLGDLAINESISKVLNKYQISNQAYLITEMCNVDKNKNENISTKKFWSLLCKILPTSIYNDFYFYTIVRNYLKENEIDVAVIGGGELLANHQGFNSSLKVWIEQLKRRKVKVIVAGISGGYNVSERMFNRYQKALEKCDYINVRDNETKTLFEKFLNKPISCSPDFAFLYKKLLEEQEESTTENIVTCMIFDYQACSKKVFSGTEEEYFELWEKMIIENKSENDKVVLAYTTEEDRLCSHNFYKWLNKKSNINVELLETDSLQNLTGLFSKSKTIITGRMHAMILGLQYNNKIVPFIHKDKIRVFTDEWLSGEYNAQETNKKVEEEIYQIIKCIDR